jgi:hypothetical protein
VDKLGKIKIYLAKYIRLESWARFAPHHRAMVNAFVARMRQGLSQSSGPVFYASPSVATVANLLMVASTTRHVA